MRAVSIGPSDDRISDKPLVIARGWHGGAEGDYRAMGLVRGTRSRPLGRAEPATHLLRWT